MEYSAANPEHTSMRLTDQDLLALLPRSPEKRSTTEIFERLARSGHAVTARSIQRRLVKLSGKYPIVSDERSKPYGWSIMRDAPPTIGAISLQEAIALKMGQRYLTEALPVEVVDDLRTYFVLADEKLKESKLYRAWMDRVRLISPVQPLVKPRIARSILVACYDAVLKGLRLQLKYEKGAGTIKEYQADALSIVVRGPVTYLLVKFEWADDVALLAMHRIRSAVVTEQKNLGAPDFDLDRFIQTGAFGFFPEGTELLRVHMYDGAGTHLLETPFSAAQELKEVAAGEHVLTVRTQITQQLKWWLLGFGERIEVLAPASLRREFKGRFQAASRRYEA